MAATRIAVVALVMVVGAGFLARLAPPIVTTADIAVTELYTDLASHGQLLVGPYSRFEWHHPGPLYFYLLAPGYVAAGRAGAALYAEAVVINVAAAALLLATMLLVRRPSIAVTTGIVCLAFALRADGVVASPWTAHIVVLPALALLGLCASVADGSANLLPAAAVVATFLAQTDLALGPPTAAIVLLALGATAIRSGRARTVPYKELAIAGALSAVLWIPTILEAARHRGGNLGNLWRFFGGASGGAHTMREAVACWSYGFVGIARSDFGLPWGGHIDVASAQWATPAAVALVIALGICLVVAVRNRQSFEAWLAAVILAAALASLWGLTRVRKDILDHEIFWLVALGALTAGFVVLAAIRTLLPKALTGRRADRWFIQASVALVGGLTIVGAVQARDFIGKDERSALGHDVVPAALAIDSYLEGAHARAALIEVEASAWAQAVPIILRLRQHHRRVAVSPANVFMFTDALAPTGREDAWLKITAAGQSPDDGASVVFDSYRVVVVAEPGRFPGLR
ncbi:MAG TPA: hypothetical protein VGL62_04545 [Vicinamibacterales bacterium]|jgi:hypothetical protein